MSSVYNAVRLANLVLFALALIFAILNLVDHKNILGTDVTYTVSVVASLAVAFLGAYGSYTHNRTYLLTFALIYFIAVILQAFSTVLPNYSSAVTVAFLVLTIVQAELLRRRLRY